MHVNLYKFLKVRAEKYNNYVENLIATARNLVAQMKRRPGILRP